MNSEPGNLARFTFPYYTSILALPGGGAIAVWMRQEPPYRPLVYRRAPDATAAFGEERYLGTEKFRRTISIVPSVIRGASPGALYAAWQAREPASGDKSVVFRRSDDGGATWTEEHAVNSTPTPFIPAMAADPDGAVYLAWVDERHNKRRVFFTRSLDGGKTWLDEDVNLEAGDPGEGGAVAVDIASDGAGQVLVVWEREFSRGRSIQSIVSGDRGETWGDIVRVDDDEPGRYSPMAPKVEFATGRAIVSWTAAATNSAARVWSDSTADLGAGWGEDVLVNEVEKGVPANVDLVSRNGTAHLVFGAGPYRGDWHVHHTQAAADGTWTGMQQVTTGEGHFTNPRLAIDADGHLALTFVRDLKRIYLSDSLGGGEAWRERLVYEVPEDQKGVTVRYPQISMADGVAYVLWEEWADRAGVFKTLADANSKILPADLYVRRAVLQR